MDPSDVVPDRCDPADASAAIVPGQPARMDAVYTITYQYYTVYREQPADSEDDNPVFDGMRLYVQGRCRSGIDSLNSGWVDQEQHEPAATACTRPIALPTAPFRPAPLDFQIRWNRTDTTGQRQVGFPGRHAAEQLRPQGGRLSVQDRQRHRHLDGPRAGRQGADGQHVAPGPGNRLRDTAEVCPAESDPGDALRDVHRAGRQSALILPTQGNVFEVKTTQTVRCGGSYTFTTTASKFDAARRRRYSTGSRVVPNPVCGLQRPRDCPAVQLDAAARTELQFRNLPPQCTIRIYTHGRANWWTRSTRTTPTATPTGAFSPMKDSGSPTACISTTWTCRASERRSGGSR